MASEKPFKPLEEFTEASPGGFALIEQAKENPDVLVKDISIMSDNIDGPLFLKHYDFDTFKREVIEPIRFLQEHGFKKFIPAIQPIWGKDENGKEKGFLVMKRVRGVDIENLEEISPRIAKELDIFISKYFEATSEAIISGGDVTSPDISKFTGSGLELYNIMIGKVSGDKEEHVYLIDLYPTKTKKIYYQRIGLEKERQDWFTLIDSLRQKAGGKYDFLPAQAALRNYLATLERWQKQGEKKINEPPKEKEKPPLEFEVKVGAETSLEDIKSKLLSSKIFSGFQFIGTDNLDLYIGGHGHSELMRKNGIQWRNILIDGNVTVKNGNIKINYYEGRGNTDSDIKMAIEKALNKFLKDIGL